MTSTFNRFEKKFLLKRDQVEHIKKELSPYIKQDDNASLSYYTICNIYFDTANDDLIKRSISKPIFKEKLRLRCYGIPKDRDLMYLEIKKKLNGQVNKRRTLITYEDAFQLINEKVMPIKKKYHNTQVLNEIYFFVYKKDLIPKISISYDREAYFAISDEALRITLDYNISSRRENLSLGRKIEDKLIIEDDLVLMEIKTINAFPLWLSNILSEAHIYSNSFSKYGTEFYSYLITQREGDQKCLNPYLASQALQSI